MAQIASAVLGVPFETVRVVHSTAPPCPGGAGRHVGPRSPAGRRWSSAVAEQTQAVVAKRASHPRVAFQARRWTRPISRKPRGGAGSRRRDRRTRDHMGGKRRGGAAADLRSRPPEAIDPRPSRVVGTFLFRELESIASCSWCARVAVAEVATSRPATRGWRAGCRGRRLAAGDPRKPMLVDGQSPWSGWAQGIAQALYEEVRYDETGNPVSGNLSTYRACRRAVGAAVGSRSRRYGDVPHLARTRWAAKGSCASRPRSGLTPAVQSAVIDALAIWGRARSTWRCCRPESGVRARSATPADVTGSPRRGQAFDQVGGADAAGRRS